MAPLALDYRGRGLAGQASGVKQIVVRKDPYCAGPLQSGERGLHRAAQHVVERQEARRLPCPQHEVREPFGPVGEGANHQRLG